MFEFQRNKAEYLYHHTKSYTAINFILKNNVYFKMQSSVYTICRSMGLKIKELYV